MSEAGIVRRRRSPAEAAALVAESEASGLMQEVFCEQCGLAVGTLDKYRRRVHKGQQSSNGSMLPVEVVWSTGKNPNRDTGHDGALVVESRGGRRVEVRGFDAGTLERLLIVLNRTQAVFGSKGSVRSFGTVKVTSPALVPSFRS